MFLRVAVVLAFLLACEEDPPEALDAPDGGQPGADVGGPGEDGGVPGEDVGVAGDGSLSDVGLDPDAADPVGDAGGPIDDCVPFAGALADLVTQRCGFAGCHGGAAPSAGMDLSAGEAFDSLVGAPANQVPGLLRVAPGDPEGSYLLAKLRPNPPVGQRMPMGGALSPPEIARFEAWIESGAPRDAAACEVPPDPDPVVDRITISGPPGVRVGATSMVTAEALTAEGDVVDVPLRFRSSEPLRLYSDTVGGVLGVAEGEAEVRAFYAGVESPPLVIDVIPGDPSAPDFSRDVLTLLRGRCGVPGCHTDAVEPGNLHFERDDDRLWRELVEEESEQVERIQRVEPGQPEESYLVMKLAMEVPPEGGRMPLGQTPLSAEDAAVVVRWILTGAAP